MGANIATMTGDEPYGSHDAAIAVKGERIAWLGAPTKRGDWRNHKVCRSTRHKASGSRPG